MHDTTMSDEPGMDLWESIGRNIGYLLPLRSIDIIYSRPPGFHLGISKLVKAQINPVYQEIGILTVSFTDSQF